MAQFRKEISDLIASFRGVPAASRKGYARPIRGIDGLVDACLRELRLGERRPEQVLMKNWPNIVGVGLCGATEPVKITRTGRLVVRVSHSTLKNELIFRRKELMDKIKEVLGSDEVKDLVFTS